MRYLKGISDIRLVYDPNGSSNGLVGYTDFDYARDLMRKRSLICYIFTFYRCAISWKATPQSTVALSTTEAKYMSLTEGVKEVTWMYWSY